MNTYFDGLKQLQECGYNFSNSNQSLYVLQYADNTCLIMISDGPASCHRMLNFTDKWLQWSKMKAKVSKCQCIWPLRPLQGRSTILISPSLEELYLLLVTIIPCQISQWSKYPNSSKSSIGPGNSH